MTTEKRILDNKYVPVPWSGCWLWLGATDSSGYGSVGISCGARGTQKTVGAHRLSYAETYGPIPKGMLVLHTCDIPCCVNPAHLFLGTQADNMRDAANKGKHKGGVNFVVGAKHPHAKYSQETYDTWLSSPLPHHVVAKQTGASGRVVQMYRSRHGWYK